MTGQARSDRNSPPGGVRPRPAGGDQGETVGRPQADPAGDRRRPDPRDLPAVAGRPAQRVSLRVAGNFFDAPGRLGPNAPSASAALSVSSTGSPQPVPQHAAVSRPALPVLRKATTFRNAAGDAFVRDPIGELRSIGLVADVELLSRRRRSSCTASGGYTPRSGPRGHHRRLTPAGLTVSAGRGSRSAMAARVLTTAAERVVVVRVRRGDPQRRRQRVADEPLGVHAVDRVQAELPLVVCSA